MRLPLPKSRPLRFGLLAIVVLGVGYFGWRYIGAHKSQDQEIETASIDKGQIRKIVSTSGSVEALVTVDVGSQVSGQISELYADYNTPVKKGQIIAQIDPRTYQTRVEQAKANLTVAKANIDVQKANIARAKANLLQAQRNVDRNKELASRGNVSAAALDTAVAQYESAKADLETAQAQLKNADANVSQQEAAVESAEIDLDHTKIVSPIDGIVISRSVSVGQTLTAGFQTPDLFQIAQDLTKIQIEAAVDEADIGAVKDGNPANFTVDAYPQRRFDGEVTQVRLAPTSSSNVVTYTVIIGAENARRELFPGMTANVEITTGSANNALRVPNAALRFRPPDDWLATYAPNFRDDSRRQNAGFGGQGRPSGDFANGGRQDFTKRLFDELPFKLTEEQKAAIQKDMQEVFKNMRSQFQGNGGSPLGFPGRPNNFDEIRKQIQQQRDNIMRRHLTDAQYQQYADYQSKQESVVHATVWVLGADGKPSPHRVQLGINDDRYTEIVDTDLKPGDKVITRVLEKNS